MPGIYLPERPDECAVFKDWRVRQDEERAAAEETGRKEGHMLPGPASSPLAAARRRIVRALKALLAAVAIGFFLFYWGRVDADAIPPIVTIDTSCVIDWDGWLMQCSYNPKEGIRL